MTAVMMCKSFKVIICIKTDCDIYITDIYMQYAVITFSWHVPAAILKDATPQCSAANSSAFYSPFSPFTSPLPFIT